MMKMRFATLGVLLASGSAFAGMDGFQTTSAPIDVTFESGTVFPTFDQFDDLGGTRRLESVTLVLDAAIGVDVLVQNTSDNFLNTGDYEVLVSLNTLFAIDDQSEGGGGDEGLGGGAFFGLGGISLAPINGSLSANDGIPGEGEDSISVSNSGVLNSVLMAESFLFDAFTQPDPLTSVFGPFSDILITQPDGGGGGFPLGFPFPTGDITAELTGLFINGTLTIEYGYSTVPAPSGAALVGVAGLGMLRRRR